MTKRKLLYLSDYSFSNTGFGRNTKAVLSYLQSTGKYEIVNFACGVPWETTDYRRTPWKTIGTIPTNPQELEQINRDPNFARMASYGDYLLDKVIQQEKPDIFMAVQDYWGVSFSLKRKWWDKIPCIIHTTLDSLPILPDAVKEAPNIKNYVVWSEFAEKALHKAGYNHVKTIHGAIDSKNFFRLEDSERTNLRKRFNIPNDSFIIGYVFRNQLRKSVPNLLEGYALWKSRHPESGRTFLLLHTHFNEGWNILNLADEYKVPKSEILCTYICKACGAFEVKNYFGQDCNCRFCKVEKTQVTANVQAGVTEEQLNEVYNLMDVYCHPFTSGGQEIPVEEAKLVELITLVTNYSCGEDLCVPEAGSFPLEWSKYTEIGTQFIKASTLTSSISKQLNKVFKMSTSDRRSMGEKARKWTLDNYDISVIGKKIDELLDSLPSTNYNFDEKEDLKNPTAVIPHIEDNAEWLTKMYIDILKMKVERNNDGLLYWEKMLKDGMQRQQIEDYFRKVAIDDNAKNQKIDLNDILDKNDNKRVLFVIPESIGDVFMCTSLFKSIRERYLKPEWTFYVATKAQFKNILTFNPYIDKVIDYLPQFDNLLWLEGQGSHKGYFDIVYPVHFGTQRLLNYLHNGLDKIDFNINNYLPSSVHHTGEKELPIKIYKDFIK